MISLNNSVGNIKGTPAIISDIIENRPSAENLAVGTIFISTNTGLWYQIGTNNQWSDTGGGGTPGLNDVLGTDGEAYNKQIYLYGLSNNLGLRINNSDDLTSFIELIATTNNDRYFRVQQSGPNNAPTLVISYLLNQTYARVGHDYIELKNSGNNSIFSANNIYTTYTNYATDPSSIIKNSLFENTHIFEDVTNGGTQTIQAKDDNFNDQIIDIPKYSGTIATAELGNSNTINLTSSNYTVPTVSTQDYFVITNGSVSNRIILTSGLKNLVVYNFLNQTTPVSFTTNTGDTIYGLRTSLPAGIIQVIRNGNDFYITHP